MNPPKLDNNRADGRIVSSGMSRVVLFGADRIAVRAPRAPRVPYGSISIDRFAHARVKPSRNIGRDTRCTHKRPYECLTGTLRPESRPHRTSEGFHDVCDAERRLEARVTHGARGPTPHFSGELRSLDPSKVQPKPVEPQQES